jgi:hypothetical protein
MRPQFSIAPEIDEIRIKDLTKFKQLDFVVLYLRGSKNIQSHKYDIKILQFDTAAKNIKQVQVDSRYKKQVSANFEIFSVNVLGLTSIS